jgi:diguanylate cyclase (GGDEF)-like protein
LELKLKPVHSAEGQTWRGKLVRMGLTWSMIALTAFSVLAALLVTYPLLVLIEVPDSRMFNALFVTAVAAFVVAPAAGYAFISLVFELEAAHSKLSQLSTHDGLTGIFNRGYLDSRLAIEITRAMRSNLFFSVLMIDADHFKEINDQHGHSVGDCVLQKIATACAQCLRPYDTFARYGGEEFVALLPSTSLDQACEIAERVRAAVSELVFISPSGKTIQVTISIGVGMLLGGETQTESVLHRADQAMYEAKRSGRNRWVCQKN